MSLDLRADVSPREGAHRGPPGERGERWPRGEGSGAAERACRRGCCSQRSPLSPGAQVSKVARSDLKSFKLELHPGSRHAKAAKSAGGSASLLFSSDDNTEISKWVNDLTKVVSGLHGGH